MKSPASKIRIGIVGATGSAFKRTIPALKDSEESVVVAIQGRNAEKLAEIAQLYKIPHVYSDVAAMVEDESIDVFYIATPPFLHAAAFEILALKKKPIICEKPLAHNSEASSQIYNLVTAAEMPVMIAHHLRHQPAITAIKQALNDREIGTVINVFMQWSFQLNKGAPNALWKTNPELAGPGPFFDAGVHVIDLALYFFGVPTAVSAHGFNIGFPAGYDNATALLMYPTLSVVLNSSQTCPHAGNHILIYGTEGTIESYGAIGEKSILEMRVTTKSGVRTSKYSSVNMYGEEVDSFCRSVRMGDKTPGTTLDEACAAIRVLEAIDQSRLSLKTVHL